MWGGRADKNCLSHTYDGGGSATIPAENHGPVLVGWEVLRRAAGHAEDEHQPQHQAGDVLADLSSTSSPWLGRLWRRTGLLGVMGLLSLRGGWWSGGCQLVSPAGYPC